MKYSPTYALALFCVILGSFSIRADDVDMNDPAARAAGHSVHGEAFDEGPRQQAYLMEGMPKINFPITTKNEEAQRFFNQGVGQLHGFWYFEAERSFRQVAMLDTNAAMAYWGMSMANTYNEPRAREFATKAVGLTNNVTRREQLYVESLSKFYGTTNKTKGERRDDVERHRQYVKSLEGIVEEFPDDLEAKAFLAFKIWENNGRMKISSHTATDALAREILAVEPMHPVHHARIHLWNGEVDRRALDSAARCGQSAPGIAHMWHMPGHTFTGLKRFADAAWQQEASARVDHAYMIKNRVLPDQIHNYGHNNDWLVQNFSHVGRVKDALSLAKNLIELPRHPKFNSLDKPKRQADDEDASASVSIVAMGDSAASANTKRQNSAIFGRRRLIETLVKWELWDEVIALSSTMYLEPTELPSEQASLAKAIATAHLMRGEAPDGLDAIAQYEFAIKDRKEVRQTEAEAAEAKARKAKKPDDQVLKAMNDVLQAHAGDIKSLENGLTELHVLLAMADEEEEEAREYLKDNKDLNKLLVSRVLNKFGAHKEAVEAAREALNKGTNEVQLLAHYTDLLVQAGEKDEAGKQFERLRTLAAQADLDTPVMNRLAPFAASLGLPEKWPHAYVQATDVGERPTLDSLGPVRWSPAPAPAWALRDGEDRDFSSRDFKGKPVLMVFYLGHGCSHCLEQLNSLAPKVKEFKEGGISVIGVSTDSAEGLRKTFASNSKAFEFPIVSDSTLETFKKFRAHDDFENTPLHGTFLVDGAGLIRWQDISYEPFTDIEFLLKESKRLLNLPNGMTIARSAKRPALSPRAQSQR